MRGFMSRRWWGAFCEFANITVGCLRLPINSDISIAIAVDAKWPNETIHPLICDRDFMDEAHRLSISRLRFSYQRISITPESLIMVWAKALAASNAVMSVTVAIRHGTWFEFFSHLDLLTGGAWLERVVGLQAFGAFAFCTTLFPQNQR